MQTTRPEIAGLMMEDEIASRGGNPGLFFALGQQFTNLFNNWGQRFTIIFNVTKSNILIPCPSCLSFSSPPQFLLRSSHDKLIMCCLALQMLHETLLLCRSNNITIITNPKIINKPIRILEKIALLYMLLTLPGRMFKGKFAETFVGMTGTLFSKIQELCS